MSPKMDSGGVWRAKVPEPRILTTVQHFCWFLVHQKGTWKAQKDSKLHPETSWKGRKESKLQREGSWKGPKESMWQREGSWKGPKDSKLQQEGSSKALRRAGRSPSCTRRPA